MIKANELRIGNYILFDDGKQDKITAIWEDGVNGNSHSRWYLERIMPVPLIEEWLMKFGFTKKEFDREETVSFFHGDKDRPMTRMITQLFFENGLFVLHNDKGRFYYRGIPVTSIHQLQNLHFAVTFEELTVKEMA